MRRNYTYYTTRRMSNDILIEQIIEKHVCELLREEYLRQDIRRIIHEERLYLNEASVAALLKAATNWKKIVKGMTDIIELCKGSTKYDKLKNAITTVTSGNPAKVIGWFLDSKINKVVPRTTQAAQKAVAKETCNVAGYVFDAAYADDFNAIKANVNLMFDTFNTVISFFGPVGEIASAIFTGVKSIVTDLLSNVTDFSLIIYNIIDAIIIDKLGFSINDAYKKALEIGEAIKNVARNAYNYILAAGKGVVTVGNAVANAVSYGGETGRMLNGVQQELSELKNIVNTLSQGGKLDAFCRSGRDANGANKLKVYLTKFVNTKYPDYRDQDAVNAGANRAKADGTMAKVWCDRIEDSTGIMVLKDNQLHPYWADVYERAKFIKKCNYDLNKWISALAWEYVNKQNITDPNQREALHVAVEVRYNEYIINGDYTHYGQNFQYSYTPSRQPKKGQKVQQKLPPVEHFGGQNFGIM